MAASSAARSSLCAGSSTAVDQAAMELACCPVRRTRAAPRRARWRDPVVRRSDREYQRPVEPRALQSIALAVAEARSVDLVLQRIVDGLAGEPGIALARIWLIAPGDICASCRVRAECPGQTRCLHLLASAGRSVDDCGGDWNRLTGDFRRIPLNVWKVGRIGATGTPTLMTADLATDPAIHRPEWAKAERIVAFAGQPLIFKGKTLGVLAVFSRAHIDQDQFEWLRTFADHAAVSIANAQAFDELTRLRRQIELERDHLREEVREVLAFGDIIGESPALKGALRQVERVAPTDASVLLLGETGTGKELIARAIHKRSKRSSRAFISVNCAAIPSSIVASELFGHEKGAFTGAIHRRQGRFELADGGTIFLDEVGELPAETQVMLLKVLQERQFERIGGTAPIRVDVRIIAATNRNLEAAIADGVFRADLFYRLNVFPLEMPALRERRADIPLLVEYFIDRYAKRTGKRIRDISKAMLTLLQSYDWPGNIRELQNVIERAVIISDSDTLSIDERWLSGRRTPTPLTVATAPISTLATHEKDAIEAALAETKGRVSGPFGAAARLGVPSSTLESKIKALKIDKRRFK